MGFESSTNLTVVICAPNCSWVITHACLTPTIDFLKADKHLPLLQHPFPYLTSLSKILPQSHRHPQPVPTLSSSISQQSHHPSWVPELPRMGVPNIAGLASLFLSTSESDHQVIKGGTVKWSSPQAANSLNPPLLDLGNQ